MYDPKALLKQREEILGYAREHFEEFREKAENATEIKYSSICDMLGYAYPGIIEYRRDKKLKKGKISKDKPSCERYVQYFYGEDKKPISMKKYNRFGCDMTVYFYEKDGACYAVPFLRETDAVYPVSLMKYSFAEGHISEYHEIERSSVISEIYDHSHADEGYIGCEWIHYHDSSFSTLSPELVDGLNSKLNERGISRTVSVPNDIVRRNEYYYKIYIQGKKISDIEEYKVDEDERVFIRKI